MKNLKLNQFIIFQLILAGFISTGLYAQKVSYKGVMITNEKDRPQNILIHLKRSTLTTDLDLSGLDKELQISRSKGKEKIKESDIKYLDFLEYGHIKRVFMSEDSLGFVAPNDNLVEVIFNGKISLYRDYDSDKLTTGKAAGAVAGAAVIGALGGVAYYKGGTPKTYHWLKKQDEEEILINLNSRNNLKEIMSDRPDLFNRIDHYKTFENLIRILKDFDIGYDATKKRLEDEKQNSLYGRLQQLSQLNELDTIKATETSIEKGDYVIFKSKSGHVFCVVQKIDNSTFTTIAYEKEYGKKIEYTVPTKDLLLIRNSKF
ncbi:MAG: hypothetical protein RLN79_04055 [Cytophagales bacterium]